MTDLLIIIAGAVFIGVGAFVIIELLTRTSEQAYDIERCPTCGGPVRLIVRGGGAVGDGEHSYVYAGDGGSGGEGGA